jgi:ribosomal protein S26
MCKKYEHNDDGKKQRANLDHSCKRVTKRDKALPTVTIDHNVETATKYDLARTTIKKSGEG